MLKPIIIAVDGYSSTGKSTFAKMIAGRMGYIYIDTGALYRAVALLALENGMVDGNGLLDEEGLKALLYGPNPPCITFKVSGDGRSRTFVDGRDVEGEIRSMYVSGKVSRVASLPFVREFVDGILRKIGENRGVVMDGRDIGTTVFPDAELKIFMTASPEIRAGRRQKELAVKGEIVDLKTVLENIRERDYADEHRPVSPLVKASDAIVLDNGDMTLEQQMEWFEDVLGRTCCHGSQD